MKILNIFLPYEESLELKKLNFNEECLATYRGGDLYSSYLSGYFNDWGFENNNSDGERWVSCPTFDQVFEWFRETHKLHSNIETNASQLHTGIGYDYWIWGEDSNIEIFSTPRNRLAGDYTYDIYNEAKLACLQNLIKIIKDDHKKLLTKPI